MKKVKCICPHDGKEFHGELVWETEEKFAMSIGKHKIVMHFPKKTHKYTVLEDK